MPKARKKKNSSFQTTITKSVFLYGRPNKEKLAVLRADAEFVYCSDQS